MKQGKQFLVQNSQILKVFTNKSSLDHFKMVENEKLTKDLFVKQFLKRIFTLQRLLNDSKCDFFLI